MKPYFEDGGGRVLYHGDARVILPTLQADSFGLVLTDQPFGVGKAEWDEEFPTWWFDDAQRLAPAMGLMPGVANIGRCPHEIGRLTFRWCLAAHITNGMTRGAVGFGNWIPCLVYSAAGVRLYKNCQDAKLLPVRGDMPNHPSPKPYEAVLWFLGSLPDGQVLDPFAGSGTTLRAAKDLGRKAVGIELSEAYCEVAARRLEQEVLPCMVEGA